MKLIRTLRTCLLFLLFILFAFTITSAAIPLAVCGTDTECMNRFGGNGDPEPR